MAVPGGKGMRCRLRGTEIITVSPVTGSREMTIIESVRRLHRPGPASPPSSSTFTRFSATIGGSVVVVRGAVTGGLVGVVAATVVSPNVAAAVATVVVVLMVTVVMVGVVPVDGVVLRVAVSVSLTGPG